MLNREDFIKLVADDTDYQLKDVREIINAIFGMEKEEGLIEVAMHEHGGVQFKGFGQFSVATRSARKGRNPQTGEDIMIPEKKVPHFKAGSRMKDYVVSEEE